MDSIKLKVTNKLFVISHQGVNNIYNSNKQKCNCAKKILVISKKPP